MKNIKLSTKIIGLSAILVISFSLLILLYFLPLMNRAIENEVVDKEKKLVEMAYSSVEEQYNFFKEGTLSESEAMTNAMNAVKTLKYSGSGYFWINDFDTVIVMHASNPNLDGKSQMQNKDTNGVYIFREFVKIAKSTPEGGVLKYYWPKPGMINPQPKISYVKAFTPWKWVIGTGIYVDDLTLLENTYRNQALIITAILLFLLTIIISFIVVPLNKNLNRIIRVIEKVSNHDFTEIINLNQKDELGRISGSVDKMLFELKTLIKGIKESGHTTTTTLSKINSSLKELETSAAHISSTSNELAKGSIEQAESAEKGSQGINEIVLAINDVTRDILEAETLSKTAHKLVEKGEKSIEFQLAKMNENRSAIKKTELAVSEFSLKSNEIDSILHTISDIATQTNLLALNAAIEAARAGDAGKGFAVVADEVRKLAEGSSQAVQKISEMIREIQKSIGQAVTEMNKTGALADEQELAVNETVTAFKEIASSVEIIAEKTDSIASSSEKLNESSIKIESAISSIASISEEIAAGTEEASASIDHQTSEISAIYEVSFNLTEITKRLEKDIEKFKV